VLRGSRIMQKRGEIIMNDDYEKVTKTYPDHPDKAIVPKYETQTELLADRKLQEKLDIKGKKDAKDAKVASIKNISFKDYYRPADYVAQPQYTSIVQKKAEDKRNKRARPGIGLTETFKDINSGKLPDPGLGWVQDPAIPTKALLADHRRQDTLDDQEKFGKMFATHVGGYGRIGERENCIARLTYKGKSTSMNAQLLKDRRTQEMIEDMTRKFGNQILGVHGAELPKFAGTADRTFWKMLPGYVDKPRCMSLVQLEQDRKYWAVNDGMLLADTTGLPGPACPFKTGRILPRKSKYSVTENATGRTDLLPRTDKIAPPEPRRKWKPQTRWAEAEKNYKCEGKDRALRTFTKIVEHSAARDVADAEKAQKLEQVIIKQAPRSLQNELAQQIQAEKMLHEAMTVGAKTAARSGKGDQEAGQAKGNAGDMTPGGGKSGKSGKAEGTGRHGDATPAAGGERALAGQKSGLGDAQKTAAAKNAVKAEPLLQLTGGSRGVSLMARVASPTVLEEKRGHHATRQWQSLGGTTMGETGWAGATHHSSPFRATIARGMMTGVGFLGK
jgi:hypothetical protein